MPGADRQGGSLSRPLGRPQPDVGEAQISSASGNKPESGYRRQLEAGKRGSAPATARIQKHEYLQYWTVSIRIIRGYMDSKVDCLPPALRAKHWAKYTLIAACILFCLGGAVNSGWSRYAMATPAAAYLLWIAHRTDTRKGAGQWHVRLAAIALAAGCIGISTTQDRNTFLYPILVNGTATLIKGGKVVQFSQDELALFLDDTNTAASTTDLGRTIKHHPAGATFKVVGIEHSYADLGDRINLVVHDGERSFTILHHSYGSHTDPWIKLSNQTVQHPVAQYLGLLMAWPIFPITALSIMDWTSHAGTIAAVRD
jgi:hypothetical protein